MHLVEVLKRRSEIDEIPARVVIVAYDDVSLLGAKVLHEMMLPYPLLIDVSREAYARWGLGRTNVFGAMLSPSLNWRYLKLLLKGERFLGLAPDMLQLGGDFVVSASGRLRFAYRMRDNGDRVEVSRLISELYEAARS